MKLAYYRRRDGRPARARALELARHDAGALGRAAPGARPPLPRRALRPPGPRRVADPRVAGHHRGARRRSRGASRPPRDRARVVLRSLHRRRGRDGARARRAGARRPTRPLLHGGPLRRAGDVARAGERRARRRDVGDRRRGAGPVVHAVVRRRPSGGRRTLPRDARVDPERRATRRAARRSHSGMRVEPSRRIQAPTLVVAGADDVATPAERRRVSRRVDPGRAARDHRARRAPRERRAARGPRPRPARSTSRSRSERRSRHERGAGARLRSPPGGARRRARRPRDRADDRRSRRTSRTSSRVMPGARSGRGRASTGGHGA